MPRSSSSQCTTNDAVLCDPYSTTDISGSQGGRSSILARRTVGAASAVKLAPLPARGHQCHCRTRGGYCLPSMARHYRAAGFAPEGAPAGLGAADPAQLQLAMQLLRRSPQTAAAERFWQKACEVWQAPRSSGLVILSHWLFLFASPQSP